MRLLLTMTFLILAASTAFAVDYRWTLGYGQGTLEAIIRNVNDSSINIYCPAGSEDTTPGMSVAIKGLKSSDRIKPIDKDEEELVQVIVDGKNYPFYLDHERGDIRPGTAAGKRQFHELVVALASSKQQSFAVEFPAYKKAERFSLLDARKAIGTGKSFILEGCETYP